MASQYHRPRNTRTRLTGSKNGFLAKLQFVNRFDFQTDLQHYSFPLHLPVIYSAHSVRTYSQLPFHTLSLVSSPFHHHAFMSSNTPICYWPVLQHSVLHSPTMQLSSAATSCYQYTKCKAHFSCTCHLWLSSHCCWYCCTQTTDSHWVRCVFPCITDFAGLICYTDHFW